MPGTVTSTLTLTKPTTIVQGESTIYTQLITTVTTCPPATVVPGSVTSTLTLTKPTTIVTGESTVHTQFITTVTTCPPVTITTPAAEVPSESITLTLTRTKPVPVVSGSVTTYSTFQTTITTIVPNPTITPIVAPTSNVPETTVIVITKSTPVTISGSIVTFTKAVETVTVEHSTVHPKTFESSTLAVEISSPAVPSGRAPVSSSAVPKENGGHVSNGPSGVAQPTSSGSGNVPHVVVPSGSTTISQINGASTRRISGITAACFFMAAFLI